MRVVRDEADVIEVVRVLERWHKAIRTHGMDDYPANGEDV